MAGFLTCVLTLAVAFPIGLQFLLCRISGFLSGMWQQALRLQLRVQRQIFTGFPIIPVLPGHHYSSRVAYFSDTCKLFILFLRYF